MGCVNHCRLNWPRCGCNLKSMSYVKLICCSDYDLQSMGYVKLIYCSDYDLQSIGQFLRMPHCGPLIAYPYLPAWKRLPLNSHGPGYS